MNNTSLFCTLTLLILFQMNITELRKSIVIQIQRICTPKQDIRIMVHYGNLKYWVTKHIETTQLMHHNHLQSAEHFVNKTSQKTIVVGKRLFQTQLEKYLNSHFLSFLNFQHGTWIHFNGTLLRMCSLWLIKRQWRISLKPEWIQSCANKFSSCVPCAQYSLFVILCKHEPRRRVLECSRTN